MVAEWSSGIMFLMAWRLSGFSDHLEPVWMRSAYFTAQFRASHRAAISMPSSRPLRSEKAMPLIVRPTAYKASTPSRWRDQFDLLGKGRGPAIIVVPEEPRPEGDVMSAADPSPAMQLSGMNHPELAHPHTPDSWARAVIAAGMQILVATKQSVPGGETGKPADMLVPDVTLIVWRHSATRMGATISFGGQSFSVEV